MYIHTHTHTDILCISYSCDPVIKSVAKVEIKFPSEVIGKVFLINLLLDLLHQENKLS